MTGNNRYIFASLPVNVELVELSSDGDSIWHHHGFDGGQDVMSSQVKVSEELVIAQRQRLAVRWV